MAHSVVIIRTFILCSAQISSP